MPRPAIALRARLEDYQTEALAVDPWQVAHAIGASMAKRIDVARIAPRSGNVPNGILLEAIGKKPAKMTCAADGECFCRRLPSWKGVKASYELLRSLLSNQPGGVAGMKGQTIAAVVIVSAVSILWGSAHAQAPFYQGKTIRIVVGYQGGDTHDLWARAYARHMGKHIPGNPDLVVQNMPGAGSMIAANHVYNVAKPDGLTLGSIAPGLYLAQLTGSSEVKFDWAKFSWIGTPEHNGTLLFMRADAPYKSIEDIRSAKEAPKCSATGVGTSGHMIPRLLEETLNLKFQLVTGYPGGAEQDLAMERGEVQCRAITVAAFFAREPFLTWHKNGTVRILVQTSRKRHSKIPDVPTIWEYMDKYKAGDANRRLAVVALGAGGFGSWPIVSTPGLPADRLKTLREGYAKMLQEPEFQEEAKKRRTELRPVGGEELAALAKEVSAQPAEVVERMKKLMGK